MLTQLASEPTAWALLSICTWGCYVSLRGWHKLGLWDKRSVAFAVFTALLFLNWLTYEEFQGWSDVYYFCGSQLQYCTCTFKWNARGWAKAYILWSFVLTSAAGLQRLLIQVGLNGLLPGEEVVTRESVISICWRLIPYWLNNWEQQWGAECSSMMFELPHFAVELLVILPCIQILCARLKVLVMPLVHMGHVAAAAHPAAPEAALQGAGAAAAGAAAAGQAPAAGAARAGGRGRGRPGTRGLGVPRDELAPNVLRGYWEHLPQQRHLLHRLRANAQVMAFAVVVTALAATNALVVPLLLESTVSHHPVSATIQVAGRHPDWFTNASVLNTSAMSSANLSSWQRELLASRLSAYQQPRPPLLPAQPHLPGWLHQYHRYYNQNRLPAFELGSASGGMHMLAQPLLNTVRQLQGVALPVKDRLLAAAANFWLGKDMYDLLRSAARSLTTGANASNTGSRVHVQDDAAAGAGGPSPDRSGDVHSSSDRAGVAEPAAEMAAQAVHSISTPTSETQVLQSPAATAPADAVKGTAVSSADAALSGMRRPSMTAPATAPQPQACAGRMKSFKTNLVKHSEEITKMQAPEHRSLIPLVESALAVMRLSCEKYFVLLSVFVTHLLFRERPPPAVRNLIRLNARLSTMFQKVILYSFPAVCWVYGAGFLFSLFVSCVFWGTPLMAMYESVRTAITVVRIKSLAPAGPEALERMGGNCAICWGEMHVGEQPGAAVSSSTPDTPPPPPLSGGAKVAAAGAQEAPAGDVGASTADARTAGSSCALTEAGSMSASGSGSQEASQPAAADQGKLAAACPLVCSSVATTVAADSTSASAAGNQAAAPEPQQQAACTAVQPAATAPARQSLDSIMASTAAAGTPAGAVAPAQQQAPMLEVAGVAQAQGEVGSTAVQAAAGSGQASMANGTAPSGSSAGCVAAGSAHEHAGPVRLSAPEAAAAAAGPDNATDGTAAGAAPQQQAEAGAASPARRSADGEIDAAALDEETRAWSLPCGHAYHHGCLSQWLSQCHTNGVVPTCPMCQARIQLEVRWRLPIPWHLPSDDLRAAGRHQHAAGAGGQQEGEEGEGGRRRQPHEEDSDDEVEDGAPGDEAEVGEVVVPRVAVPGLGGRQRPAGRVRAAHRRLRAHENLLLPPPLAALGGMSMLRLLDHQREVQELLADMPQIAPPEDVELLQQLAAENQALIQQVQWNVGPIQPPPAGPLHGLQQARPAARMAAADFPPGAAVAHAAQVVRQQRHQQQQRRLQQQPAVAIAPGQQGTVPTPGSGSATSRQQARAGGSSAQPLAGAAAAQQPGLPAAPKFNFNFQFKESAQALPPLQGAAATGDAGAAGPFQQLQHKDSSISFSFRMDHTTALSQAAAEGTVQTASTGAPGEVSLNPWLAAAGGSDSRPAQVVQPSSSHAAHASSQPVFDAEPDRLGSLAPQRTRPQAAPAAPPPAAVAPGMVFTGSSPPSPSSPAGSAAPGPAKGKDRRKRKAAAKEAAGASSAHTAATGSSSSAAGASRPGGLAPAPGGVCVREGVPPTRQPAPTAPPPAGMQGQQPPQPRRRLFGLFQRNRAPQGS